jgi:hypothetical protein
MQGNIYIQDEADKWFERNFSRSTSHNILTEYLVDIFQKNKLKKYTVAEFGIGTGNNVVFLSNYVKYVDGYDGAQKAVDHLNKYSKLKNNIRSKKVNLGEPFDGLSTYNLIIFGFFCYMLTDKELENLYETTKRLLKKNGYVFIYDFLARNNLSHKDSHNESLYVFKRNFDYWLDYFKDFDLIDFRLFDHEKLTFDRLKTSHCIVESNLNNSDYNWVFSSLFQLKACIE